MVQLTGYARNMTNDVKKRAEATGTITFIASTRAIDRHGSVLNQDNWHLDNFRRNPIIGYQHNVYGGDMCNAPDPDDVIGRGQNAIVVNNELVLDIVFDRDNPRGEKIFQKVLNGFLNAVSVGFSPVLDENGQESRMGEEVRGEDPNVEYYFGQELLEVSVVNIPSNPEAVKKNLKERKVKNLSYICKTIGVETKELLTMTVGEVLDKLENPTRKVSEITKDVTNTTGEGQFEYVEKLDEVNERELEEIATLMGKEVVKEIIPEGIKDAEGKPNEVSEDAGLSIDEAKTIIDKQRLKFKQNG